MTKLKLGIVLDSKIVSAYVASFCQWVLKRNEVELVAIFIPSGRSGFPDAAGRELAFRTVLSIERILLRFFKKHKGHLSTVDLTESGLVKNRRIASFAFPTGRNLDTAQLEIPRNLEIDLLVNFGSMTLPKPLLQISRLGGVRIDFRGISMNSGSPAGFWEPYYCSPVTSFSIVRTEAKFEDEQVLLEGSFRTHFAFLLNQSNLYQKSIAQLQQLLLRVSDNENFSSVKTRSAREKNFCEIPNVRQSVGYLSKLSMRLSQKALRRLLNIRQKWGIQISDTSWQEVVPRRTTKISAPPGYFWADPFLRTHNGRTYCFVEEYLYSTKRAHISVLEISGRKVAKLGVAIAESFHLSFPFIFEYDGDIFMSPEASESGQIRIYKAKSFPLAWELCAVAMNNISAADSMFFEYQGKWWMLTSIDRTGLNDHCSELCLYYSDSPLSSNWKSHPKNPIRVDAEGGRNAGLITEGGRILRAAQNQGFDQYGRGLAIYEIIKLSERDYRETKVADLSNFRPRNSLGSHHISTIGKLTVSDYLNRCFSP